MSTRKRKPLRQEVPHQEIQLVEEPSTKSMKGLALSIELALSVLRTSRRQAAVAEDLLVDVVQVFTTIETCEKHLQRLLETIPEQYRVEK